MEHVQGDMQPRLLAASIVSSAIALVTLTLRFVSRIESKTLTLWWDDWCALASAPFILALVGVNAWWVSKGLGLHISEALHYGTPSEWKKILFIENLIYNTGLSLVKLSVVLFYHRVFKQTMVYKYAIWFGGFLVVAWAIGINLLAVFECVPVHAFWDPKIPHTCVDNQKAFLAATISNVIIDIYILLVPLPMLWALRLSARRKLALTFVFICGYCVAIISIIRLVTVILMGDQLQDFTWVFVHPQTVLVIETPIALFASCLPALFQLFNNFKDKWQSSSWSSWSSSSKLISRNTAGTSVLSSAPRGSGSAIDSQTHKEFLELDSEMGSSAPSLDHQLNHGTAQVNEQQQQQRHETGYAQSIEKGIVVTNEVRIDVCGHY